MKDLYFDHNATTPVAPAVFEAMRPWLQGSFGNPSSGHAWGLEARQAVKEARHKVARLIGAEPGEIVFTGCATEANNMVVQGVMSAGGRMVTTSIEHPAVLEPARLCEDRGVDLVVLPVDGEGRVDPAVAAQAITRGTRLVSVMLANNEVGTIQPVWDMAPACIAAKALLHTDAAQAVGKVPVDVKAMGVDFLTLAGHKFYAPKGIGALYVREGLDLPPLTHGGGQEKGLRPGTENVAFIVGLGAACDLALIDMEEEMARQRRLGDILLDGLERLGTPITLHAASTRRLPNTMSISFWGHDSTRLLEATALAGVAVSAGAACHGPSAGTISHVLAAMGVPDVQGRSTLRFSWGRTTTEDHVLELVSRMPRIFEQSLS